MSEFLNVIVDLMYNLFFSLSTLSYIKVNISS